LAARLIRAVVTAAAPTRWRATPHRLYAGTGEAAGTDERPNVGVNDG
jgi:hypothetical protein